MWWNRAGFFHSCGRLAIGCLLMLAVAPECRSDTVIMKNGLIYISQGAPDKDNSLVYIWDGLKRVIVRDTKIEKIEADNAFRTGERFQLVQPIVVHAGAMPREVLSVKAGPWDDRGRREFRYIGARTGSTDNHGASDHRDRPARGPLSRDQRILAGSHRDRPDSALSRDGSAGTGRSQERR